MAFRRDEMWPEGRYDYERLPRQRLPPRGLHPDAEYHRIVHFPSKRIPLERPEEGDHHRYEDYREYEESHCFEHDRRSGPPFRGDDPGYRWQREEHHMSRHLERHPEYRESREGFRRKPFYPPHIRDRSPQKRDSPYFRESPVSRKDSPHSRSGSSVSSRSYSPERSKAYPAHQSQHNRSKERSIQSLKSSRDASPSSSTAMSSSKANALEKSSRLSEAALAEAASKWAAEKKDKTDESSLPEITDEYATSSAALFGDQPEDHEAKAELFETNRLESRSKAIAAKTKEIEEVYRQDCETFGMVVKMLIEKDPSLEKPVQFALKQNLQEIGERCIEELKHFITSYDTTSQEFAENF
ncbi:periphilin-1 isoform X2 [Rhinatrema bivittatum]|uniref:periphilin-1 isoform X2 n=1 Tax=Rhinatrema bivittatum TaxID=194408 RepID=UPI001125F462|nr:periphilin-1 isoform X2 [Rhinatrema bivittatum]XP_029472643.1 periphilin-1 isoform X2 [Rhinatrema bivittatum]XP_029472644.1 periphilin-1 isoform X2 [Rhinatrema bivittatum]XP_029472645.1 periphilin-1 isoform X2 [Rhinatrema bivittatum]